MVRWLKRSLLALVVLLVLMIVAGAAYVYFKPLPVSPNMLLNVALGRGLDATHAPEFAADHLRAPPGFSVTLYARLPKVRMLRFTAGGDLLASRPRLGEVVLLGSSDADGQPRLRVLLSGLDKPHGIDIANGWLYVGESDAIGRVRFDENTGQLQSDYERIVTGLTGDGFHWTKTVRIGPDGYLYVAQGSSCNVCAETDKRRATIMRFKPDGSDGEIYARGLRNSVGMDWAPWNGQLYATDNGRDLLGDNFPPDELNRIVEGGFYGWPYINGFGVLDPDMGAGKAALLNKAIAPVYGFRAHNAPLGIHFLRSARMPAGYEHAALVALHGSWNRSVKDGYKVVALHWRDDGSIDATDFLTGFEKNGRVVGRPVDIAEGPDGALYISDDYAGAIYRVAYGEAAAADEQPAVVPTPVPQTDSGLQALSPAERAQLSAWGEAVYDRYPCRSCHDPRTASGLHRALVLKKLSSRYTLAQLQNFFTAPTPPMPLIPLDARERRALAVYLLTRDR